MNSSTENMANNIDPKLNEELRRYYNNELSPTERNLLERRALEDPFLRDAMDGFDEKPESFNRYYNKYKSRLAGKRNYTFLIGVFVLIAMFGITTLLKTDKPNSNASTIAQNQDKPDTNNRVTDFENEEYEMLPPEIETLVFIPEKELISVQDVVDYQAQNDIQPSETADNQTVETINVDDPIELVDDFEIEDENPHKLGQESVETVYMFNLRVVDYRLMRRAHEKITYKRYEFGGTPANEEAYEEVDGEPKNDLIERDVEVPYHIYLTKSMSFFAKSNFKPALNRYLLILEQYPDDMNAQFYGGLAYYNLGKYKNSINFFDQILNSEFIIYKEEALWYKAKSLLKQKKTDQTILILESIIAGGGFYTKDAIDLRTTLQ